MLSLLNRFLEEILGAVLLAAMAAIAFVNVAVRYLSNFSFAWSEEMTVNLFVWVVLLGSSAVFRDGGHLSMSLLFNALGTRARWACHFLGAAFGLCFFGALCYYGCLEVLDEIDLEVTSESLGIPVWWYTLCTPALSALVMLRIVQSSARALRSGRP
ncbi:MAG: TRAP transporter small permease [Succinivibrionaceae bacterium]|nr:TRAP transporter small permease [Succinivibrionaceae bacterium]